MISTPHVAHRFFEASYRLMVAKMTIPEALAILGLKGNPTPEEIQKAYRQKAIQNHPDRGGDLETMKLVNVAKDVLDRKDQERWRPEPTPRPQPMTPQEARKFLGLPPDSWPSPKEIFDAYLAKKQANPELADQAGVAQRVLLEEDRTREKPTLSGKTWEQAKGDLPSGVQWKILSDRAVIDSSKVKNDHPWTTLQLLYGEKDGKGFAAAVMHQTASTYPLEVEGQRVMLAESWDVKWSAIPANTDLGKKLPAYFKNMLGGWKTVNKADLTFQLPKKWFTWPEGTLLTDKTLEAASRGRGVALKDAMLGAGIGGEASRKAQVQIRTEYNDEKSAKLRAERRLVKQPVYAHETIDVFVIINGKEYKLSDESVHNLVDGPGVRMFPYIIPYKDIADKRTWDLTKLRGGRFKATPAYAIQVLSDALTSEPSSLLLSLYAIAESYEDAEAKKASLRSLVYATSLDTVAALTGETLFDLFYGL